LKDTLRKLKNKGLNDRLTTEELACALYEGTAHVQNLAEKTARTYGKAEALTFYDMMSADVQNFWRGIAVQIQNHSKEWKENVGSGCVLSERERLRLRALPRVPEGE
jgi:predicted ATPase